MHFCRGKKKYVRKAINKLFIKTWLKINKIKLILYKLQDKYFFKNIPFVW